MKFLYKINRWFDINLGWLFVNGRKAEEWEKYIKDKYFKDI